MKCDEDLYIAVQIAGCIFSYLVQNKIIKGAEEDNKELISGISDDILKWLEGECEKNEIYQKISRIHRLYTISWREVQRLAVSK